MTSSIASITKLKPSSHPEIFFKGMMFSKLREMEISTQATQKKVDALKKEIDAIEDKTSKEYQDKYQEMLNLNYELVLFLFQNIVVDKSGDPFADVTSIEDVQNNVDSSIFQLVIEEGMESLSGKSLKKT